MGCAGSKNKKMHRASNVSEAPERTSPTAAGGSLVARGQYKFAAQLTPEVIDKIPDDPNATVVERTDVKYIQGVTYTGEMKGRQRHGKGRLVWPDGAEYVGQWENDMANGKGVFVHGGQDGPSYDGEWKNDKANGFGTFKQADGATYEGDWKDDVNHGHGKETWPDGSTFAGYYENGRKEGRGVFEWPDKSKYNGEFHMNEIEGWGRYDWPDGRVYCGQWIDNKMHGYGWFFWPNGQIYRGQYDQDKKEGWGEFLWPDKKVYRGWWKSGKQSGFGTFRSPKGEEKSGMWQNGSRLNWLTPEQLEEKKAAKDIPSDPDLPTLPGWLDELCKQAVPTWYREMEGISVPGTTVTESKPTASPPAVQKSTSSIARMEKSSSVEPKQSIASMDAT